MINSINYQGRLTNDPELKTINGFSVVEFTVAWNEKYKEAETDSFLPCKAFTHTADFISGYFKKGQEIIIEGKNVTEHWEKDGHKQSRNVCYVNKAHFCGPKSADSNKGNTPAISPANDEFMNIPDSVDEELPFN